MPGEPDNMVQVVWTAWSNLSYHRCMTITMNIQEAKGHLSALVAKAEAGEEVIIARAGKPAVQLKPVAGRGKVQFDIFPTHFSDEEAAEAMAPLPDEIAELFYNSTI
jgi:prevent-host-death family protein